MNVLLYKRYDLGIEITSDWKATFVSSFVVLNHERGVFEAIKILIFYVLQSKLSSSRIEYTQKFREYLNVLCH